MVHLKFDPTTGKLLFLGDHMVEDALRNISEKKEMIKLFEQATETREREEICPSQLDFQKYQHVDNIVKNCTVLELNCPYCGEAVVVEVVPDPSTEEYEGHFSTLPGHKGPAYYLALELMRKQAQEIQMELQNKQAWDAIREHECRRENERI